MSRVRNPVCGKNKNMQENIIIQNPNSRNKKPKLEIKRMAKKPIIALGVVVLLFFVIQIVNAAKYTMVVNVKDGQNVMGVNPLADNLDFGDLSRENGMTRYVTLKNGGRTLTYVSIWKFGEISDLIKVDEGSFILKPGEEKKIAFEISIPVSAETRRYSGWVWIFRLPKII